VYGADSTWSTFNPGVELSPVNGVELLIFCDYMDDFNPGVEILYVPGIGYIGIASIFFPCNK
jgi:hypothetical protein